MGKEIEKYSVVFFQQQLKKDKEKMFRAKAGSKTHTNAVIRFDKHRMELESMMVQLGVSKKFRKKDFEKGIENTLPFKKINL